MNTLRNSVKLIGNIGSDLQLSKTKSGVPYLKFSIATNDYFVTSKGERTKETQWHKLIAWDKQAEYIANNISKGNTVHVEGKLTYNSYKGEDGETKYFTEIKVASILKLTREVIAKEDAPF